MLISINELKEKFAINISGILHIGAHNCEELNDYLGEVISIGDCQMPRTCEEAVLEGLRAAHNLG